MKKIYFLFSVMILGALISSCDKKDKDKWNPVPKVPDVENVTSSCWVDETAWACGDEYDLTGNWFTYTDYWRNRTAAQNLPQPREWFSKILISGRDHMYAGLVTFTPETIDDKEMVKITIQLYNGWRFEDVEENVKAQDYESIPEGKIKIGQFAFKYDVANSVPNIFTFWLPLNNYYGVHVDVQRNTCN